MLSQLAFKIKPNRLVTKIDLGQWHLVAFFLRKMILVKTQYKTHNGEFLAIIEAFKSWCHYLESCMHKVIVLIDHSNFCHFMDTKNLSSKQVCLAQKLSQYHFQIHYY